MHPESHRILGQIVAPSGGEALPSRVPASTAMSVEQIVAPRGVYSGPERRAQGTLVAEILGGEPGFSEPTSAEEL